MKITFRLLALFLSFALLLPMAVACGGGEASESKSESESRSESASDSESESESVTDPVSGVTFAGETVFWDGEVHSLAVTNLPEGVTVTYEGNGQSEIGTYPVTATFTVPEGMAPIAPMTATLTVKFDESRFVTDGPFTFEGEARRALVRVAPGLANELVRIPDSVTYIAPFAAFGVPALKGVVVPPSVTAIGEYALGFEGFRENPTKMEDFTLYATHGVGFTEYIATYHITCSTASPYSGISAPEHLRVAEGLSLLLDVSDPARIDLSRGIWHATLGSATATLHGSAWKLQNGGVGYAMTYDEWRASGASTGISLDLSLIESGNFTVEALLLGFGTHTESGDRDVEHTGQYGQYMETVSAFSFGPFCSMQFLGSNAPAGSHMQTRWFYHNGTWSDRPSGSQNVNLFGEEDMVAMTVSGRRTAEAASLSVYRNAIGSVNFSAAGDQLLPPDVGDFHLMYAFPGTAYEIRVYDHPLTAEEIARNHLADLGTYRGLDLSVLATLTDSEVSRVADAFRSVSFSESKEALQKRLDDLVAALTALTVKSSVTVNFRTCDSNEPFQTVTVTGFTGERYSVPAPTVEEYFPEKAACQGTFSNKESEILEIVYYYNLWSEEEMAEFIQKHFSGISCWGDSLTAGAGGQGTTYPNALEKLIAETFFPGVKVTNCGVGGETSSTIASRTGAEDYKMTLGEGITIPAGTTPVEIKIAYNYCSGRQGILRQGGGNSVNPVTIAGIEGTLSLSLVKNAPEGAALPTCSEEYLVYTFQRSKAGEEKTVAAGEDIVVYGSYAYDGTWCVIYIGCNGGWRSIDELIDQQEAILEAVKCPEGKYIILGNHFGTVDQYAEMDRRMAERWGDHYVPLRSYFASEQAYLDAGATPAELEQYRDAREAGITSTYFLVDGVHLNATGYSLIARQIFFRMSSLGFFDEFVEEITAPLK